MKPQFRSIFVCLFLIFSLGAFSQVTIDSEDFESGWGIWNDGGNKCKRDSYAIPNVAPDEFSVELKDDDGGTKSSMTTDDIDITSYDSIDLSFNYQASSMESGEDFWVRYSDDGGGSWTTIQSFVSGTDFSNGSVYSTTISIDTSSYTFSSNSQFRITCDANDGNDKVYFDNVLIEGTLAAPSYCDSYGDTVYDTGITLVDFNTISNASDLPTNDYSDFTSISTTVAQSSSHDLTVNLNTDGDYSIYAMVWIDWNQDLDFDDAGESYSLGYSSDTDDGPTSLSALTISVPAGATIGSTRMRVSAKWDGSEDNDGAVDPPPTNCETGFDGEVEDYTINVIAGVSESIIDIVGNGTTLTIGQTAISTSDDTDFGSLAEASGTATNTFTIENNGSIDLSSIAISISGHTSDFTLDTSSTLTTVTSGGSTTFTVTFDPTVVGTRSAIISIISNDTDRSPYTFTVGGEGSLYCGSYGNSDNDMGISRVILGDIDNSTTTSSATYSDYTALSTEIEQGSSEDLTIKIDTDGHYTVFATVWVDWNQDGDFDDTDESHNIEYAHNGDENTYGSIYSLSVPYNATVGNTRMRVTSKWVGSSNEMHDNDYDPNDPEEYRPSFDPCETDLDGEVEDYTINVTARPPMIDFDGMDDYVDFGDNHDLLSSISIESWILQESDVSNGTIVSKGDIYSSNSKSYGYFLSVQNKYINFTTYNNGGSAKINITSLYPITNNRWYHIAVAYDGTNATLYIDGLDVGSDTSSGAPGDRAESYFIGAAYDSDDTDPINYFDGFIDEVRIWNIALSETQIREMMNQEIEKNGTAVKGKVVPRDISGGLLWSDLVAYYDMNTEEATDASDSGIDGFSNNITSSQSQTAPLPYTTARDGEWDETNSTTPWLYGDSVWNIPNNNGVDGTTKIDWNIVSVSHNIDVDRSLKVLGLISESTAIITDEEIIDSELTMGSDGNDYELNITNYLKLDGKIDLQNESQLVQGDGSWLDVDSSGYVERDQQGNANSYTYNYWSSPVSKRDISANNVAHTSGGVMRDGHRATQDDIVGLDFDPDSTSSVNPYYADGSAADPRKIATYWMWKFTSSQTNDYDNWEWVGNYHDINVTEGFTMKGTSGSGDIDMGVENQNYVFRGKPNNVLNGDTEIVHTSFTASFDTNENPKISLAGNPFLSAIDADAFIDDNTNSINGQLYFWEHWGGGTHKWQQYQGGYSIYTKAGGNAAVLHSDVDQTGSGTKTPEQFIPVGQGFYVIQKHDVDGSNIPTTAYGGDVVFKNSQRIFKTESSGESLFTKEANPKSKKNSKTTYDKTKRIRIGFESSDGFYRPTMAAFLDGATDEIDHGYDGVAGDFLKNDAFFFQDNRYLVINAFGQFDVKKELPIAVFVDEEGQGGIQKFSVQSIENFDQNIQVYIKDKQNNGETYEITKSTFEIQLEPGEYKDRFSLVFQSKLVDVKSLSKIDESVKIYVDNKQSVLNIEKYADIDILDATLFNYLGQPVRFWDTDLEFRNIQLPVNMSTGVYILSIKTSSGIISKKVFIE